MLHNFPFVHGVSCANTSEPSKSEKQTLVNNFTALRAEEDSTVATLPKNRERPTSWSRQEREGLGRIQQLLRYLRTGRGQLYWDPTWTTKFKCT